MEVQNTESGNASFSSGRSDRCGVPVVSVAAHMPGLAWRELGPGERCPGRRSPGHHQANGVVGCAAVAAGHVGFLAMGVQADFEHGRGFQQKSAASQ
jgi:hypothetical protein